LDKTGGLTCKENEEIGREIIDALMLVDGMVK
jgi:hypothetical protein